MSQSRASNLSVHMTKYKWTLIITFVEMVILVGASYVVGAGKFSPETFFMGLIISLIISLIASRFEEIRDQSEVTESTITSLKNVVSRLESLIGPMKVEPMSNRPDTYKVAEEILNDFIKQHRRPDQSVGSLLVIQRTPTPLFPPKEHVAGCIEERCFGKKLKDAIKLAKHGNIKMVYAFSITDPEFLGKFGQLQSHVERISKFEEMFYDNDDRLKYWNNLRLYPMEARSAHPLIVADNSVTVWIGEVTEERMYIRATDEKGSKELFEKYWRSSGNIPPANVHLLLTELEQAQRPNPKKHKLNRQKHHQQTVNKNRKIMNPERKEKGLDLSALNPP